MRGVRVVPGPIRVFTGFTGGFVGDFGSAAPPAFPFTPFFVPAFFGPVFLAIRRLHVCAGSTNRARRGS